MLLARPPPAPVTMATLPSKRMSAPAMGVPRDCCSEEVAVDATQRARGEGRIGASSERERAMSEGAVASGRAAMLL